jgi:hypothetical protein
MEAVMNNSAQKIQQQGQDYFSPVIVNAAGEKFENVVQFLAQNKLIAQEAEEACGLEGNQNSADFDLFEEKYGLLEFA